ncbi:MAG: hypothetical protein L0312_24105 [Acidobacteria bacterium]|nr:hypothetical protein [Acidobacteriota bacterium]
MTLQARFSEHDPRLYNVNRDVAHNFGDVMREVAARLEDERWLILADALKHYDVTQDDLGEACAAFCRFVASAVEKPKETMSACLARAGWFGCPDVAQMAVMAILGTVLSGYYWVGVREATLKGSGPALSYQDLRARGEECARLMQMSRLKRRWFMFKERLQRGWQALFGGPNL